MTDPVRTHAEARPEAEALVTETGTCTWADLDARVGAAARHLGEGPERVAVLARTSPDLVVLVLASLRAGRTLVPLSTRWTEAAVAGALARLGVERLIVGPEQAAPAGPEAVPLADVVREAGAASGGDLNLNRPWTVVHTSGSTGAPKAALHTVGNHVWSARGVIERMDLRAGDRWLLDLPLYHVGGLGVVVRCALAGAAVAVPEPGTPTAEAVARFRPTHASLVATQLRRLLDADADLSSFRAVLLGGSAIPADLLDEAVRRGVPVATSYGLTEMTSTVTATAPGASREAIATSGTVLPHREVRVTEAGEIEVGGLALFAGYLTPDGLDAPGVWHPTGDLGHLDAAGRLVVTGRRDLMFVSGGENVQPEAIEAALLRLDAVAEALVVPVADAEFGHRPVAFARSASEDALDPEAVRAALRSD
ncbi:MAG: AMP-binding protein, partial [Bacteroidota bacterium]